MKTAAFQAKWAGTDPESIAVRKELARIFPERAAGALPGWEDDAADVAELGETLADLAVELEDGVLADATVPDALRTLVTFLVFEDYATGADGRRWPLYGVDDFVEMNGEDGTVGGLKAKKQFPGGVFAFAQDLYLDTRAETQPQVGAVIHALGANVAAAKVIAPSLAAFLARCT